MQKNNKFVIALASDHKGYALKSVLIEYLLPHYNILDLGTTSFEPVDYPDYAKLLCDSILERKASLGVLICGSGIGMSITANRQSHIRAALCVTASMAHFARKHNDANVLVLGAKVTGEDLSTDILEEFLNTEFEGGRQKSRINKIN